MLATVEEVLQTMTDDDIVYDDNYPAQFLIDNDLRIITVPSDGVVLGVENDKDVNLVKFKMPRFYKKKDLSSFNIRVIFENAKGELGYYMVPNKEINEDSLEFGWILDHTVTAYKGSVRFIVRLTTLKEDNTVETASDSADTVTAQVDQAFDTTIGTANVLESLSIDQDYTPGQVQDVLQKLQHYADSIVNKVSTQLTGKVNSAVEEATAATKAANMATANTNKATETANNLISKVYPVVENVLKGTAKGTLLHIDDNFPSNPFGVEIEGAYEQHGMPSPDNTVNIIVVKNLAVVFTGKNLLKFPFINVSEGLNESNGITYTQNDDGSILVSGMATAKSSQELDYVTDIRALRGKKICCGIDNDSSIINMVVDCFDVEGNIKNICQYVDGESIKNVVPENADRLRCYIYINKSTIELNEIIRPYIQFASDDIGYSSYTETVIPLILPEEHPYLAKLPDGTADKVVVDAEGNIELVASIFVDENVREVGDFSRGKYYELVSKVPPFNSTSAEFSTTVLCDALPSRTDSVSSQGIYRTRTGIRVIDTSGRTKEEIQAEVDKNAPLTIVAHMPERHYLLGKLDSNVLPKPIFNIMVEATVIPNISIEYMRDVNIAVAKLESAIASITES